VSWYEWREAPRAAFAVIGDPIAHSLSPSMQNAGLRALGRDEQYVAIRVTTPELRQAVLHLKELGYIGLNVTVPHKEHICELLQDIEPLAARIGAVNTVHLASMLGRNTDAPGFAKTLEQFQLGMRPNVLVLGAGGSARAILAALEPLNPNLEIWNRTADRAEKVLAELQIPGEVVETPELAGKDLIVNCTSGVGGAMLPLDWNDAHDRAIAYDLMYGHRATDFLEGARQRGLKTLDGLGMLVEQGALSMEGWLSIQASRSAMLQGLQEAHEQNRPADPSRD
jgi:shikimate dehydrogenase